MTFLELQTELYARGFDYLNQDAAGRTRAKRWLNAARAEFDRTVLWPWRETTATGTAPLTIADLGVVQSVVDTTRSSSQLSKVDRQTLVESYGDLSIAGAPWAYFIDWSSGSRQVAVYPTTTNTISVRYWKVTPDLVADGDTPVSPSETHDLIVDLAIRRAYRDSDNHESAVAMQQEIAIQLDQLLFQYPPGQADGPDSYVGVSYASGDW